MVGFYDGPFLCFGPQCTRNSKMYTARWKYEKDLITVLK
jgi:hypothetical protein